MSPLRSFWRGGVFYQIYPRSFYDSDADGVGDLAGVLQKLDYIASLGVDGLWLSPFFRSPMKDYGYDVSDYLAVDPLFGSMADFDALLSRAHDLKLKVIIDQVYSHTSDQHAWFAQSRSSRDNPKGDWYVWADAKPDGSPPNNWQALFGGPSWTWDARRRQYYLHNFLPSQPDLNLRNAAVQDALLETARFWFRRGVDGLRLDVANFYVQDAQLRDNPALQITQPAARPHQFQRHLYDRSQPEALDFIARLRTLADSFPHRFLLGEIEDEEPLVRQREYTNGPDRLHSAYSFFLLRAQEASPSVFLQAMESWRGAAGWPSWSLSNHDVPRFPSRLAGDFSPRVKLIMMLLLCLRGAIFLYQGDELGLPQADVPFHRLKDPEAIAFWPNGIGRDGARTPMPWSAEAPMAGFTAAADSWLPLDPAHRILAVGAQEADPTSMLHFTRRMIALRQAHPALRDGDWTARTAADDVLAFERKTQDQRILCAFNLGGGDTYFADEDAAGACVLETLGGAAVAQGGVILPANAGVILHVS